MQVVIVVVFRPLLCILFRIVLFIMLVHLCRIRVANKLMAFEVLFPCTVVICKRFKQIEKALVIIKYLIPHIYIIYKKEKGRPGGPFKSYYLGLVLFEK